MLSLNNIAAYTDDPCRGIGLWKAGNDLNEGAFSNPIDMDDDQ
jgi:hypothetical protein